MAGAKVVSGEWAKTEMKEGGWRGIYMKAEGDGDPGWKLAQNLLWSGNGTGQCAGIPLFLSVP